MERLAQIRDLIQEREYDDWRREMETRQFELRTLASFIAGSAGNSAGIKEAQQITLIEEKAVKRGKRQAPPKTDEEIKQQVDDGTLRAIPFGAVGTWFSKT